MFCPSCRSEYRPGFTRCQDCDVKLVDALNPEPEPVVINDGLEDLVVVYKADRISAEVMRSVLEGSGIQTAMSGSGAQGAYPFTVGVFGEGSVLVRSVDEEAAREIIRAAEAGELDLEGT
jgi:Putative prokaryotic signal transducing protein